MAINKVETREKDIIIYLSLKKIEELGISKRQLAKQLDLNYPNLVSVLKGTLVNYNIINTLKEWVNK